MGLFSKIKSLFKKEKPILGLALGSGGARGMALIGALKVFEEENIKFDIVTGCSIGSVVGGMYAAGYNSAEMLGFLREYYIHDFKRLLIMKLKGFTVEKILDNMLGGIKFEDLKLPFYAIACDLYSGEEVVMETGDLANAMACSSAIPPYFKPVERNGKKLIDGALLNSLPADVCRKKGAEVVIAINITEEAMNTKTKEVLDQMYREHKIPECDRLSKGANAADFMLAPDMSAYSLLAINHLDEMYRKGYNAAKTEMPKIKELLIKNNLLKK